MAKHSKKKQATRASVVPAVAPDVELRRGLAAFEQGAYAEAIRAWQRVRHAVPDGAVGRGLAEAHFRLGLNASTSSHAVREFEEATALAPDRAVYWLHLGLAFHRQAQIRRAIEAYEKAHHLAPTDERISYHLALALLTDSATTPARSLLDGAGSRAGEAIVRLRALAELMLGQPDAALAIIKGQKSPTTAALVVRGMAELAAGQYVDSRESLTKVQRRSRQADDGTRRVAGLVLAMVSLRMGDLAGAQKLLQSAGPVSDALSAHVASRLAIELVLDGQLDEAIAASRLALLARPVPECIHPFVAHLHEVAAARAVGCGAFDLAAQHYEAALAEQPGDLRILHNLALAEERLESWQSAAEHWEQIIRQWQKDLRLAKKDDDVDERRHRLRAIYRHLVDLYESADDLRAALRMIDRAISADPADVELQRRAAGFCLDLEDYSGAISHYRRVLTARPNDVTTLVDLGTAYSIKGDNHQSEIYLQQAYAIEPNNPAVRDALATTHHERAHELADERLDERAIAEYRQAMELDPSDSTHYSCLGELFLSLDRVAEADAEFNVLFMLRPNDAHALVEVGGTYLRYHQEAQADKLFRRATRMSRGYEIQVAIGVLYLAEGQKDKAEPYLKRVLRGRDPQMLHLVGDALVGTGARAEAIPFFERLIKIDKLDVRAHLSLAFACATGLHDYERAGREIDLAEEAALRTGDLSRRTLIEVARTTNNAMLQGTLVPPELF